MRLLYYSPIIISRLISRVFPSVDFPTELCSLIHIPPLTFLHATLRLHSFIHSFHSLWVPILYSFFLFLSFFFCLSLLCCSILFSSLRARSFSTEFGLFVAAFPQHTNTMAQADRKWRGSLIARHCWCQGKSGERGRMEGEVTGVWGDKCNEGWWPRDSGASWKSDGLASKPAFVGSIAFNWSQWRIRYTVSVCWVFWND